eukprot:4051390-Amphidinium_carterae.1
MANKKVKGKWNIWKNVARRDADAIWQMPWVPISDQGSQSEGQSLISLTSSSWRLWVRPMTGLLLGNFACNRIDDCPIFEKTNYIAKLHVTHITAPKKGRLETAVVVVSP